MVFPLRKGPSGPDADIGGNVPLSNVFFVDGGTTVATEDQDGSINAPFATIAQVIELFTDLDDLTAVLTPNTYDDFVLDAPKTLRLVGLASAQFVNIDVSNGALLTMENIHINNLEVTEASLMMVNSRYNVCTLSDVLSAQIDLATLGRSRTEGAGEPTGTFDVMDAPTITVEFNVPALTAPESANVTVAVPLAQPGDVFVVAGRPETSPWPVEAMLGMPRCDVVGQVIVPVIAAGGNVAASTCELTVTIMPVARA